MNHMKRSNPQPGQLYKHFKGNLYQIVTIAENTETDEALVIYQALYGTFKVYARPLNMFMSEVDKEKYPDVTQTYRFEQIMPEKEGQTQKNIADFQTAEADCSEINSENDLPITAEEQKPQLDDGIWEFLDAKSFEERLRIFTGMQHRLNDEMINIMAVSMDTEVPEGKLTDRVASLKNYLLMQVKFECSRVR